MPPVNLRKHVGQANVNMVTCGGQATVPMVHAVSRVVPVEYAAIDRAAIIASIRAMETDGQSDVLGYRLLREPQYDAEKVTVLVEVVGAGDFLPTDAGNLDIRTGVDPLRMFDVAEDVVLPIMEHEPNLSRLGLIMGYAGVYSSVLKHAYRAGERYGVAGADILLRCGQRKLVGGQEDQIIDIASELAAERAAAG